jgi:DNA-binding GntR family transcriptional regulator
MPALLDDTSHGVLLKEQLVSALKQVIVTGRLHAGQRVVEPVRRQEFSVAQASVREAINLLITEGSLVKDAGRSARVVNYHKQDVRHIYEVRAALEGLAAQLACSNGSDLSGVEAALERMAIAAERRLMKELVQRNLDFHIALTRAPGNPVLAEIGVKFLFRYLRLFRSASSRASKDRTPGSATRRITVWCCT